MNSPSYLLARLGERAEKLRARLAAIWASDPTVLASFDADLKSLIEDIENGQVKHAHVLHILTIIYRGLLPAGGTPKQDILLSSPGARSVPYHGQFYHLLRPGVWLAIDYAESKAYRESVPKRTIWLTYTKGARQQL